MELGPAVQRAMPTQRLRLFDAMALVVGVIVGAGIFRAPGLVAGGAGSELMVAGLWLLGGALSMAGALCYGELATSFPSPGGEYHFLRRAFGGNLAFLFAWARLTVICTGSIALLAFIFGDYASRLLSLGPHSSAIYACAVVVALTALNALGLRFGTAVQNVFTAAVVLALLGLAIAGLAAEPPAVSAPPSEATMSVGLAMVFVLLTFGGWNEAAYLSAEVRGGGRRIAMAVIGGVGAVTVLYLLVNLAYLRVLGLDGLRASDTVGADMVSALAGPTGARLVSALIAAAAITSMNATIVTGSRTGFALGRDFGVFRALGRWDAAIGAPVPALLVQGGVVLGLIALGALSRGGFETMVEYTAPVFWGFFLLTGVALLVLRAREPGTPRPFRVPLFPVTPLVFCASCTWLLYASLAHTGIGAAVGVGVLVLGAVPLLIERGRTRSVRKEPS